MNSLCMPILTKLPMVYTGKLLLGFSWMLDHDGYFSFDIRTGEVRGWGDFICFKSFATEDNLTGDGDVYENDLYVVHGDYSRLSYLQSIEPWHPWNLFSGDGSFSLLNYGYNPPLNSFTFGPNSNIYNNYKYSVATRRVYVWEGCFDAWKGTSVETSYPRLTDTFRDRRVQGTPYKNYNTNIIVPKYPSTTIVFYGLDHGAYNAKYNIVFSIEPDINFSNNILYIITNDIPVNNKNFTPKKGVNYA